MGGVAAVDQVVAAGDERGGIRDEEGDEGGDLVWGAEPTESVLAREERLGLLVEARIYKRRDNEPGADRVNPDALRAVFERGVLGQADDRVLGGHVGSGVGKADRTEDGGDVDDRAPVLRGGDGGQLRAHAVEDGVLVDFDDTPPGVKRIIPHRRGGAGDARVVYGDAQRPEFAGRRHAAA